MGEGASRVDRSIERLQAVLASEKGSGNKRKFLSDLSVDVPSDVSTLSLTEFPRYEMLEEKFRNALAELGSMMERSQESFDDSETEEFENWEDPVACQLEQLLTNNLLTTFRGAIKNIVECGYTEEDAEWAILNSGLFHGCKDAISNVVDGAVALLKREKELNIPKCSVFEGLESLVHYTILEMIHVLREVRPALTVAEAMWCLLISDLNLLNACLVERETSGGSNGLEAPPHEVETSGNSSSGSDKLENPKTIMPDAQSSQPETPVSGPANQLPISTLRPGDLLAKGKANSLTLQEAKGKFSTIAREHMQTSSQPSDMDEKMGCGRKGSCANSKRDMLRQKTFHFEKSYKGRMSKGAFKAKVAAWGSMVLDKSLKSQSGGSSLVMKGTHPKMANSAGTNAPPSDSSQNSSNSSEPIKDPVCALPEANSSSPASSAPDPNPSPNGKNLPDLPKAIDYYAGIPYDEALQKYVPRDDKDETILMLLPHKQALERETQGWTDWANEKVMQAARRLGKDKGELRTLRQEKEEAEKCKKENQILEESTMKRLSEMEHALTNATGQIEVANSTVRRLEEENSMLKKEMMAAEVQAMHSGTRLQEAVVREQEALKKCQSCDAKRGLHREQLMNLKRHTTELNNQIEKAKGRKDQFKVLLKHEEKEKARVLAEINSIHKQVEEEDALTEREADNIRQTAEANLQKCKEDINILEKTISALRLESEKSKIAALNVGYTGKGNNSSFHETHLPKITKRLAVFQDNFGNGSVEPERECVMCMTEEISVVFLPCAHQVLCGECSLLHEKQGMNECPSCRTAIQKRISVRYRGD